MNQGWIKLHRSLLDNPICHKADWAWLWIVLLLLANHEDRSIIWNGEKRVIKRGSFITSRQQLALHSGIHQSSIERALKYLKNEQQIEQQTDRQSRLITIIKYNDYQIGEQQSEQRVNNERTTSEQRVNTNKNDNNINNYKNEKKEREDTPSKKMQEFIKSVKERNLNFQYLLKDLHSTKNIPVDVAGAELDKFTNYWCEKSKSGTKERWELEKTFEVQKRLATWFSRAGQYQNKQDRGVTFIS